MTASNERGELPRPSEKTSIEMDGAVFEEAPPAKRGETEQLETKQAKTQAPTDQTSENMGDLIDFDDAVGAQHTLDGKEQGDNKELSQDEEKEREQRSHVEATASTVSAHETLPKPQIHTESGQPLPQPPADDADISKGAEGLSMEDKPTPTTERERVRSPTPPPPPPKDDKFLIQSREPPANPPTQPPTTEYNEKQPFEDAATSEPAKDDDSRSEIQSIMDQFEHDTASPELEKIMSPVSHPPRSSSLEQTQSTMGSPVLHRTQSKESYVFSPSAVRPASISGASISSIQRNRESTASPRPPSTLFQPPPPSPDPEPTLPFDFHRFLEQLRHRTADPVARFLRSFLMEFGKKQWMVHEQVKIISDFLEFISKKMALCEVWRTVSDPEFDNAREGMEKLVMNRLYNQTFSPAIPPVEPLSPTKGRRNRNQPSAAQAPGRKGQHQEDVERDAVIAQKIKIYGWIREEHLDIPAVNDKGRKFLVLAQQELLKINSYRAPRDKVICVLNCCKVIFGFLKNSKGDQSADSFVPLLIYTVLRASPEHLVSNVQYILRFRNQEKLGGEAGYYISSLMGVVSFVENLDRTNLTVTDEEFERNVEAAVSTIAEGHKAEEYESATHGNRANTLEPPSPTKYQPHYSEKGAPSRPELTPRNSTEGERAGPSRGNSTRQQKPANVDSSDDNDEKDAVAGLLRTIQKPLSTIGRIFSDDGATSSPASQHPALTPKPASTPRLSPGLSRPLQRKSSEGSRRRLSPERQQQQQQQPRARSAGPPRNDPHADEDAAARQARAEAAEAQRIQAQEHRVVVE